ALAGGHGPALPPALDRLDTAAHLPGDLHVPPGGLLMSGGENAGPLDFGKRGRVTAAELLQLSLLLWCELDGILGQRSWHTDSPPDQAQVSRMVIGQDLAHVKPATYLLRTALRDIKSASASRLFSQNRKAEVSIFISRTYQTHSVSLGY